MGRLPPRVRLKKLDEELKSQYVSPESRALVLLGLGKNEVAISWLEKDLRQPKSTLLAACFIVAACYICVQLVYKKAVLKGLKMDLL